MIALIITIIALFVYCCISEKRLKKSNDELINLKMRLSKEGISYE